MLPAPTVSPDSREDRIPTVEALRGLAAVSVAWFHVTNANMAFPRAEWLRASGGWGWLGVEGFFVISGFVLPLALHRAGYRIQDAGRFLVRRLVRLHPAYLVSLVVTLALWWVSSLSPGFDRAPPSTAQILLHLVYLPPAFGYTWLNAVYWTLGIEIQFCLLLAVSFPLLAHPASGARLIWFAAAAALPFMVTSELTVLRYLVLFAMGATAFLMVTGRIGRTAGVAMLTLLALDTWYLHGFPAAVAASATAVLIALHARLVWRPLLSVGALSYSLYLTHAPISGRVVNLGSRYVDSVAGELVVTLLAMLVSLAAAAVLYRLVEEPSLRLARRLKRTPDSQRVPRIVRRTGANWVS